LKLSDLKINRKNGCKSGIPTDIDNQEISIFPEKSTGKKFFSFSSLLKCGLRQN
jgi:hypothetical protein